MKNYKEEQWVRVLDSTYSPTQEPRKLIGKVLKVSTWHYYDSTAGVYDEKEESSFTFNRSDVQRVWKDCVKDGWVIGEGDEIEYANNVYVVFDAYRVHKGWCIMAHIKGDENDTMGFFMTEKFKILHKSSETITIDGKTYLATDVRERITSLKEIKNLTRE